MSRPRKAVKAVERQACAMWRTAGLAAPHIQFREIEARMFGMGEVLRDLGESAASGEAFFLASLAGHLSRGELADVRQSDCFADAEARN